MSQVYKLDLRRSIIELKAVFPMPGAPTSHSPGRSIIELKVKSVISCPL